MVTNCNNNYDNTYKDYAEKCMNYMKTNLHISYYTVIE